MRACMAMTGVKEAGVLIDDDVVDDLVTSSKKKDTIFFKSP